MAVFKYKTIKGQTKWAAKFYYENKRTGERMQKKKEGFDFKRDAEEYERQFIFEMQQAETEKALLLPFPKFAKLYLDSKKNNIAMTTYNNYKYIFNNYLYKSFNKPLINITTAELQRWTDSLIPKHNISQARAKGIYRQMRAIFNYAERVYGLLPNPVRNLRPPKVREKHKEMQFWTLDEFKAVLECVNGLKYKAMLSVLFYTGIRKGELFGLQWADIHGDIMTINKQLQRVNGESYITPTKTSSSTRKILLPKQVTEILEEWKQQGHYGEQIFEWEKTRLEDAIKEACKRSGIKRIRVHDLRHSHASYLISKGANIELISKRLGHTKTSMTLDTYGHLYPTDEEKLISLIEDEK